MSAEKLSGTKALKMNKSVKQVDSSKTEKVQVPKGTVPLYRYHICNGDRFVSFFYTTNPDNLGKIGISILDGLISDKPLYKAETALN